MLLASGPGLTLGWPPQTTDLHNCMREHSDYYSDILYEQAGEQSLEGVQDEMLEHEHKALEGGLPAARRVQQLPTVWLGQAHPTSPGPAWCMLLDAALRRQHERCH